MKQALKQAGKRLVSWGYALQRRGRVQRKVILLGHMRSGSSLMVHLLASNPDIAGYGETHLQYDSAEDLEKLSNHVYFTLKRLRPSPLVLDKVLHTEYFATDEVLRAEHCVFPIMAREPLASVSSMARWLPGWFQQRFPDSSDAIGLAADYYRRRLDALARYAELLAGLGRSWYFTYDDLLRDTAAVFRMLEQCLELRQPLSEQYRIGDHTGIHGYGDPSDRIKSGQIDRTIVREPLPVPDHLAEVLTKHYHNFDAYVRGLNCSQKEAGGTPAPQKQTIASSCSAGVPPAF